MSKEIKSYKKFHCKHDECNYYVNSGMKKRRALFFYRDGEIQAKCPSCGQNSTIHVVCDECKNILDKKEKKVNIMELLEGLNGKA